jgi:hypothetical protein
MRGLENLSGICREEMNTDHENEELEPISGDRESEQETRTTEMGQSVGSKTPEQQDSDRS